MYAENFNNLIKEICKDQNIEVEEMSYGYMLNLKKDNKEHYIIGYKFELNNQVAASIAKDKYATYELLKKKDIPVIKYKILFNEESRKEYCRKGSLEKAKEFFYKNNKSIVIKPNTGQEGKDVFFCNKEEKINSILKKIYRQNNSAVLCPYYNIKTEYRTIYLNGKCMLTYGKNIPYIIGDGKSNIKELLKKEQNLELENIREENLREIDFNYIPKENEKVEVLWKHNLSGGANPKILEDGSLKTKIQDIVRKTAEAINIKFSSIDVIETISGELYVLEVNSGIFMGNFIEKHPEGKNIAKEIYSEAIKEIFKK